MLTGINVEGSRGSGAATDYNVTSYPTILYFEKGQYKMKFTGDRTATGTPYQRSLLVEDTSRYLIAHFLFYPLLFSYSLPLSTGIVTWLEDPREEATPAAEPEKSWADEDTSPVAHLTTDTFAGFMKEHASVLVMFYAPWCGHCKAMKPEFSAAATRLLEDGVEGNKALSIH